VFAKRWRLAHGLRSIRELIRPSSLIHLFSKPQPYKGSLYTRRPAQKRRLFAEAVRQAFFRHRPQ
jgi:hypothetical protein